MKMNEELFYKLEPFNNHFNLRKLNDYIFGRREIEKNNYLEEPTKALKKELRLS